MKSRTFLSADVGRIADLNTKIREAAAQLRDQPLHLVSAVPSDFLNLLEELRVAWSVDNFSRIWPHLSVITYSGTPIAPYRAQITRLLGRPVQFIRMYLSTEARLGYEIPWLNGGVNELFSFHFGDVVFTFRKLEGDGPSTRRSS